MKRIIFMTILLLTILPSYSRQPERGYRGFVEWSNSYTREKYTFFEETGSYTSHYRGISTSHGFQINPTYFVGAGLSMEKYADNDSWLAPVFLQGRADLKLGKFTPFADIRLGYNTAKNGDAYLSPTIGYRLNWGRKLGVNLGLGLTVVGYKTYNYEISEIAPDEYELNYTGSKHAMHAFFTFRLGIDF